MLVYCAYCGNAKVELRKGQDKLNKPCNFCKEHLTGTLAEAWKRFKALVASEGRCCSGLIVRNGVKPHLFLHPNGWESSYPEGEKNPTPTSVEHGINFYADHASGYYIFDSEHDTESKNYGPDVLYTNPNFDDELRKVAVGAARAAWDDDVCTCEHCGYNYFGPNGPCDCQEEGEDEE